MFNYSERLSHFVPKIIKIMFNYCTYNQMIMMYVVPKIMIMFNYSKPGKEAKSKVQIDFKEIECTFRCILEQLFQICIMQPEYE